MSIRELTVVEKTKFTDHVISFFRSKLEEGFLYLPPYSLVVGYTNALSQATAESGFQEELMSLHLKFHLALLRFLAKDPLGFSQSVASEAALQDYFMQLFRVFGSAHLLAHVSDTENIIGLARELTIEIVRVLYLQQDSQRTSPVASI